MKILVIANSENDFSECIRTNTNCDILSFEDATNIDITKYDSYCIIGGTENQPYVLNAV